MSAGAAGRGAGRDAADAGGVALDHGRFLRLRRSAGATVAAVDGLLWVTHDGRWDDLMLEPGRRYVVPDDTPVLIGAFGPSLARVTLPPRRARWRRAVDRWLGRRRGP